MGHPHFRVGDTYMITNEDAPSWLRYPDGSPRKFKVMALPDDGSVESAPLNQADNSIDEALYRARDWRIVNGADDTEGIISREPRTQQS